MNAARAILSFEDVSTSPTDSNDVRLDHLNFRLGAGDLMLVMMQGAMTRTPLADLAIGAAAPARGRVAFNGRDWLTMSADEVALHRAAIGRVFDEAEWISNLDLDENITLPQRHHTSRTDQEILLEAQSLAAMFGLDALPGERVHLLRRRDLAVGACVRAFLGRPDLVLLERPVREMFEDVMPGLTRATAAARQRGAAVLWMTSGARVWQSTELNPTVRAVAEDAQLRWFAEVKHG